MIQESAGGRRLPAQRGKQMVETILSVRNLTRQFKGVLAVDHIRMDLEKGGIYGLIGTNGAGKSTVINMISGSIPPTEGEILFKGMDIGRTDAAGRAKAGIARTFQNIRLFGNLSVADNVRIAMHAQREANPLQILFRTPKFFRDEEIFDYTSGAFGFIYGDGEAK